ncbi:poly(aspartic acid) hydrolase protein [Apiospora rasikravindrae]|uniref:Poly(Aspartic acid) hydrolase protein n=1 Tax=Apiospora rasikravindrae TaxID=990691 RepID=A0ABR1RRB1_9PEZI
MDRPLPAADVPLQFFKAVYLTGRVPWRALGSDDRVSYALYIPPDHYLSTTAIITGKNKPLPLLVYIHGTRRDISSLYTDLEDFAESVPCAVLAPLFPAGLDDGYAADDDGLSSYKTLWSPSLRYDLALLSMLEEVASRWPDALDTDRVYLMGFSGGGQFAHRFLYLYPERLAAVSVDAPRRVTSLTNDDDWPRGVANTAALFDGRVVDPRRVAPVPVQLASHHIASSSGSAGGESGGGKELPPMKQGRLDATKQLQEQWAATGIEARLDVVRGAAHDAEKVRVCALRIMRSLMDQGLKISQ